MELSQMERRELIEVYGTYGPRYFPSEELKPLSTVEWLLDKGIYAAYGYYDKGQLLAYACLIRIPGQEALLLDYYAVLEQYRSAGIGGAFLKTLADELSGQAGFYIESENPDFAHDEEDLDIRRRRIAFYERNGARGTGILSQLFGVDYTVLFYPCPGASTGMEERNGQARFSPDWHRTRLESIYREMFPAKLYDTKVRITAL